LFVINSPVSLNYSDASRVETLYLERHVLSLNVLCPLRRQPLKRCCIEPNDTDSPFQVTNSATLLKPEADAV